MKNSKVKAAIFIGAAVGIAYGALTVLKSIKNNLKVGAQYANAEVYDPYDFETPGAEF
jgi:hypothetical protein